MIGEFDNLYDLMINSEFCNLACYDIDTSNSLKVKIENKEKIKPLLKLDNLFILNNNIVCMWGLMCVEGFLSVGFEYMCRTGKQGRDKPETR